MGGCWEAREQSTGLESSLPCPWAWITATVSPSVKLWWDQKLSSKSGDGDSPLGTLASPLHLCLLAQPIWDRCVFWVCLVGGVLQHTGHKPVYLDTLLALHTPGQGCVQSLGAQARLGGR